MQNYTLVKNYRNDAALRASFNELAGKTFGLSFEDWYQNGFWGEQYDPYSIVIGERVIANVSVNLTDFFWNGVKRSFIQLGTVMTEEGFRNQGLIRRIMEEIEKDFGDKTEGMYLFANDSVLEFYPKFGFKSAVQKQFTGKVCAHLPGSMHQVPMKDKKDWDKFLGAVRESVPQGRLELSGNEGLIMFYVTKFMQENVYYSEDLQAYAIAQIEGDELLLYQVFAREKVELQRVAEAFGSSIRRVTFGFTPENREGYQGEVLRMEDTTLFLKGEGLSNFQDEGLMFPLLAYA